MLWEDGRNLWAWRVREPPPERRIIELYFNTSQRSCCMWLGGHRVNAKLDALQLVLHGVSATGSSTCTTSSSRGSSYGPWGELLDGEGYTAFDAADVDGAKLAELASLCDQVGVRLEMLSDGASRGNSAADLSLALASSAEARYRNPQPGGGAESFGRAEARDFGRPSAVFVASSSSSSPPGETSSYPVMERAVVAKSSAPGSTAEALSQESSSFPPMERAAIAKFPAPESTAEASLRWPFELAKSAEMSLNSPGTQSEDTPAPVLTATPTKLQPVAENRKSTEGAPEKKRPGRDPVLRQAALKSSRPLRTANSLRQKGNVPQTLPQRLSAPRPRPTPRP